MHSPPHDLEVLIAGAGPVGLLLANLLGGRGLRVQVVERRAEPPVHSMAIGITPPSLAILKDLGLDRTFVDRGVAIQTARVFESGAELGTVDFSRIPAAHRFILSLPQAITIQILREHLHSSPTVQLHEGVEVIDVAQSPDHVRVTLEDVSSKRRWDVRTRYLAGCDGHRSSVRRLSKIKAATRQYPSRFIMADVDDDQGRDAAAHVFFSPRGSAESFPLPDGRRRWITQTGHEPVETSEIGQSVIHLVYERTGVDLSSSAIHAQSAFQPSRTRVRRYVQGRVALCGDAAHVMSPIGGQGMNTGFADAALLAETFATALNSPTAAPRVFAHYDSVRRRAFQVAANRAARGMWLGTRRGRTLSALRRAFINQVLFRSPVRNQLAPYFAMLTIPGSPATHPETVADAPVV